MIQIPASDLIQGQIFQLRRGELARRSFVVMVNDELYAVPLDGEQSGYAAPLFEAVDATDNVYLSD